MEQQALQVVSEFLTAAQQGNHEKLVTSLHPDVTWSQPGNNRFSGLKKSRTELFEMVGGMAQVSGHTLALTKVAAMSANGNKVACVVHWKAVQETGAVLDVDNIDVYTVENGQIVNAVVYSSDVVQEDNFWLK